MKQLLKRTTHILKTVAGGVQTVAGTVKKVMNPPLSEDAQPLDVQHAILEAIELRAQPVGGGRRALPEPYVKVRVLVRGTAEERAMQTVLAGIRERAAKRLREVRCEVPSEFRVDVTYLRRRPARWPDQQSLTIEFEVPMPGATDKIATALREQPELTLKVLRGSATRAKYYLREPVVRVGRSETPVDHLGRIRQNHVAFLEGDDEHNKTVGRGHCEIRYDNKSGQYRIFDERSANGTRIVRAGELIDVPPKDPFGVVIVSGDQLQFGTAAVQVEIQPTTRTA